MKVQKMAEKGSKYARKKQRIKDKEEEKQRKEMAGGEKFLEVVYNDAEFLHIFHELSLPEQIKAYRTLKRLMEGLNAAHLSETDRLLGEMAEFKLEKINAVAGLKLEERRYYGLSKDELHLIRMDCYGTVDARPNHQLSDFYKEFIRNTLKDKPSVADYDLNNSPAWKLYRQFDSFRKIEPNICEYMAQKGINPKAVEVMGVYDFSDVIFKTFRTDENQIKVSFKKGDSPRNAYVKALARKYGDRIAEILRTENYDERYIQSLLSAMKNYGVSDKSRIIITETNFTPRVLADLAAENISCGKYKVGDKIPQALVKRLMKADKGGLLTARDANGHKLVSENFPDFEVHHKTAVMESGRLAYIAMVNYRNNFVLTPTDVHRHVLHGFDILTSSGSKESYHRRLEFLDSDVTFMFGFTSDKQIAYNWSRSRDYVRKVEEDIENIVSYEAINSELAETRQKYLSETEVESFDLDDVVKSIKSKHHKEIKLKKNNLSKTELKKLSKTEFLDKILNKKCKTR